jgi:hypothetical protein
MSGSSVPSVVCSRAHVLFTLLCLFANSGIQQPMEKSVTFTGACANEMIPSINRSIVYKAKEDVMLEYVLNLRYNDEHHCRLNLLYIYSSSSECNISI